MKYSRADSPQRQAKEYGVSRQAIYKSMPPRPNPTFDADGYPTEETLKIIQEWEIRSNFAIRDLLSYVKDCWRYGFPTKAGGSKNQKWISVSTGGWSGNESIIGALRNNRMFWALCWLESRRGGGYKFLTHPIHENK